MNIILTGLSKGLGLVIAEKLLTEGNTVYGISRSLTSELSELIQRFPDNLFWKQFDLMNSDSIPQEIFKNWLNFEIKIDVFINNAAIAYDDIITNINLNYLENMYRVNVFSPLLMAKHSIRNMLFHNTKYGSIIHISSISVHTGYKGLSLYASTKGALEAFSKNTAREWGTIPVRSNCLVAGFMETEMSSTLSDQQKNRIYNRTSLKKPVSVDSVSEMILFLISDKAKSITGQNIFVDSGTI